MPPSRQRIVWERRIAALSALVASAAAVVIVVTLGTRAVSGGADAARAAEGGGEAPSRRSAPGRRAAGLTIGWVGDLTPGSRYGVPPAGGRAQFAAVRDLLRKPDVTIANLEGTYSTGGASKCAAAASAACFAFQAPPGHARALRWAGIDAVNLANNHAYDFGAQGQRQTLRALNRAGLAATGRPGEITVLRRRGLRVALVGFAAYPWAASITDLSAVRALVARAARRADVTVALFHAGAEGADRTRTPAGPETAFGEQRGDPRAFARAAVAAGADLVLGSGPHVIRGVERRSGRLVAYSLGNFAGWNNFAGGGTLALSGLLRVKVDRRGAARGGRWASLRLEGPGRPVPDPSGEAAALAARLSREDFGAAAGLAADGRVRP